MFLGMAWNNPKPTKREALVMAARDHAAALREQPGCLGTFVLTERGGPAQVSISVFENEQAFERALEATRAVIAAHHLDELLEAPSSFRFFDVH